jgi:hypothetical protein
VYQPIASLLAVQPPLATTFNIASSPSHLLTLADGFTPAAGTFPDDVRDRSGVSRVRGAHWDASIQPTSRALTLRPLLAPRART